MRYTLLYYFQGQPAVSGLMSPFFVCRATNLHLEVTKRVTYPPLRGSTTWQIKKVKGDVTERDSSGALLISTDPSGLADRKRLAALVGSTNRLTCIGRN